MLKAIDTDLWVAEQPLKYFGLEVGTRMTVIRLTSGKLMVISPIAMDDATINELNQLGELTLCGLKTRRFSKTCLKGIVKYPPRRSKQLPVPEVLQLRLLRIQLMLWEFITSQFGTLHVFPLLVYPGLQLVQVRGKSGVAPYKTLRVRR
ncbi:DUF4336 domain-containing protein [Nostoc sp. XA010]|uniref:DUF4336 domain-containing protein n=1 Tax=Nostoc sp. XA010 TaxID=2780407 RepID=UPI001E33B8EE|nr:DUF4336 domain-containing protein [Nostoc sp. XA010]MCC5657308.1 DUF4336 domain-containing protein [Nostoc sp. XA010]